MALNSIESTDVTTRRNYIRDNFHCTTLAELSKMFSVSERTISKDASLLGLESKRKTGSNKINPNYTASDIDFIKQNRHLTAAQLAVQLGRTLHSVKYKLKTLEISIGKKRDYSKEEDEFIKQNLSSLGLTVVAKKMGRTFNQVRGRARALQLC